MGGGGIFAVLEMLSVSEIQCALPPERECTADSNIRGQLPQLQPWSGYFATQYANQLKQPNLGEVSRIKLAWLWQIAEPTVPTVEGTVRAVRAVRRLLSYSVLCNTAQLHEHPFPGMHCSWEVTVVGGCMSS